MNYIVEKSPIRLDVFLSQETGLSRSNIKNLIEQDRVLVNEKSKRKSGIELRTGDNVCIDIPEPRILDLTPQDIPLDIVYEDEYIAVINKEKGMVVHPATSYQKNDTLVNALLFHLDNLSGINGVIRPGIVHRLDKDTSGLIVIAKNDEAHKSLAKQIEEKTAKRIYYGLCDGNFKEDEGRIDKGIARNKRDRKKMAIDDNGRDSVTNYSIVSRYGKYTLVRFELETGRTHQIRIHSSSIHHPIVGDTLYNGSSVLYKKGQLLHAKELIIVHPKTGETMHFQAQLPTHFQEVLDRIKSQLIE